MAKRVVIIGGLAAGPKCAAKIKRLEPDAEVIIIEKGRYLSFGTCGFPYYIEREVKDITDLMKTSAGVIRDRVYFKEVKDIDARTQSMVINVDRENKKVRVRDLVSNDTYELSYDFLVFATGARPAIPPIEGINYRNIFVARTPEDAITIDRFLEENPEAPVVVVGAGAIGLEMAEAFKMRGARVTVVELAPHVLPPVEPEISEIVKAHLEEKGITVLTSTKVMKFEDDGEGYVAKVITDRGELPARMVLLATGVKPNVELAKEAGLKIGETGAIWVNESMQTSDPFIYAAGDCAETTNLITGRKVFIPLGSTANKQGRVAAINICGQKAVFPGVIGTLILKAFDLNVARTGLSYKEAKEAGFIPERVIISSPDKPEFMPQAKPLILELIADKKTGRILGVQAVGPGDVNKRIDVAATALYFKSSIWDLMGVDLAYAPPFAPAVDNIIKACWAMENRLNGAYEGITSLELKEALDEKRDIVILDVRTPWECAEANIPAKVINIPLGQLRRRINEVPKDKEVVILCKSGARAYEAYCILKAKGYDNVKVLCGGLIAWPYSKEKGVC